MHETGIEGYYALKDGKKLQYGYTTGTCAAAAAKAASLYLLSGKAPQFVRLMTPKGIELNLEVLNPEYENGTASCAIRKYSGDDPDVTNGILVFASVSLSNDPGIMIDGGIGVGRVTKPGLKQAIGQAAINPVPMEMIRSAVREAMDELEDAKGVSVVISVPDGVEIAKKTFNPRLGIVGGISILGTTGIVEPMSEEALIESIAIEIRQKHALYPEERLIIVPGNYGADFLRDTYAIEETRMVKCSNYIGKTLDIAEEEGYREVFLVGNIGKLAKLGCGIMNTHSKEADGRAEVMAACAIRAGCSAQCANKILESVTTEEMLRIMKEERCLDEAMKVLGEKVGFYLENRVKGRITIGCIVFSETLGILCASGPAMEWAQEYQKRADSNEA
ncbi:MAG: cobalamin biosynthesis protein CbiD [Clostridia bacterium]|nr:cobalamin biosynthesis protein CbiD [Clostridia bacterium]